MAEFNTTEVEEAEFRVAQDVIERHREENKYVMEYARELRLYVDATLALFIMSRLDRYVMLVWVIVGEIIILGLTLYYLHNHWLRNRMIVRWLFVVIVIYVTWNMEMCEALILFSPYTIARFNSLLDAIIKTNMIMFALMHSGDGGGHTDLKKNTMVEEWTRVSILKGYQGCGVIPFLDTEDGLRFVLGINKDGKAEYPGGKIEEIDTGPISTALRELKEETGLVLSEDRLSNEPFRIDGGTTGYPAYVFTTKISEDEFASMSGKGDGTFSEFIRVKTIFPEDGGDCVIDDKGDRYVIRNFIRKYVLSQLVGNFKV